jgi:hypothetical protein
MAGLWSVKFDYKNGEDRTCKECNEPFHTMKPTYICTICRNKKQKVIQLKLRETKGRKAYYPFDNKGTESSNRFCRIRTQLSNAWKEYDKTGDKSVVIAHYDKQLKEIHENGIWEWIWDRRDDETIKGRSIKSKEMIRKDLPDTRGHYED